MAGDIIQPPRPDRPLQEFKRVPPSHRMTVVETICHQLAGQNPVSYGRPFTRKLKSEEAPYSRPMKIGEEWKLLDCGWVPDVGMMLLTNEEKGVGMIIEVSQTIDFSNPFLVFPQESLRGTPNDARRIWIRSRRGICKYTLTLIPE